jgi:hypothetical protein
MEISRVQKLMQVQVSSHTWLAGPCIAAIG